MEFILQRKSPVQKIGGLAAVVAFHVVIVLIFMQGLMQHRIAFTPPSSIDWVSIVAPTPPPPNVTLPKPVATAVATAEILPPVVTDIPPVNIDAIAVAPPEQSVVPATGQSTVIDSAQGNVSASLGAACPNAQGIRSTIRYPAQARLDGLSGEVVARFLVTATGEIRDINIVSSSNRAFNGAVTSAVKQFSCIAQGRDVTVEVPFSFKLE